MAGMDTIDKVNFAFNAYDFESTESLFYDEVTLLFRACARGLKKSCPTQAVFASVTNSDAESYATLFYQNLEKDQSSEKINFLEFRVFCCTHPVISSWLKMVSSIPSGSNSRSNQVSLGMDDLDVVLYKSWPRYSVFEAGQLHAVKLFRVVNPLDLATKITEADLPQANEPSAVNAGLSVNDANSELSSQMTPYREMTAEEEEELERIRAEEAEARKKAALPPPPPLTWFKAADKARPEDLPPLRKDAPQDTLSPLWMHGFGSSSAPRMKRTGFYTHNGSVLYPASNHVITMKKDEEGVWSQQVLSEHKFPITCMDMDGTATLLATGDRVMGFDDFGEPTQPNFFAVVNIWNLKTGAVKGTITAPASAAGVRYLDFSADGKLLLVLMEDNFNTLNIYNVDSLTLVFTKKLFDPVGGTSSVAEKILDVKFSGTDSIFATAGTFGMTFYVDEGASFMNPQGLRCYEKRAALYQKIGQDASSTVTTSLCRFEYPDEIVAGTAVRTYLTYP
jgi:hypothetical protein